MKIERTRNATRGIFFGSIMKIYQMIIPFLMRTAMIYFMGIEYLGLNSLFTSVLQVLNLAELGVGSAMVFSMYKPIADDDDAMICALMKLYRTYYRCIGFFIAVMGVLAIPFLPNLISGDIPNELNIYILYIFNLISTVLTYWLFAYKNCLLQAYQRTDITSIITIFTNTIQYSAQIVILIVLKNYYLYVIMILVTQILNNLLTAYIVGRMYPNYIPKGVMNTENIRMINNRIKDLFTGKLGGVILNSTDTLIISAFLGLRVLAIYQNYYFIVTSVIGLIEIIITSMMAGLGNSFVTETREKNFADLKKFTFMFVWLSGICVCCFLCLFQPFMELWVGKSLTLNIFAVVCFCVYFFTYEINRLLNVYKDAAGLWHEDRFRPLVTSLVNLVISLIGVRILGIYGVLFGTIISMIFVGMPWLLHNMFTVFFETSFAQRYIIQLLKYTAVVAMIAMITYAVCSLVDFGKWGTLIGRSVICVCLPNVIFFCIYHENQQFRQSVQLLDKMTKDKLRLEDKFFKVTKLFR